MEFMHSLLPSHIVPAGKEVPRPSPSSEKEPRKHPPGVHLTDRHLQRAPSCDSSFLWESRAGSCHQSPLHAASTSGLSTDAEALTSPCHTLPVIPAAVLGLGSGSGSGFSYVPPSGSSWGDAPFSPHPPRCPPRTASSRSRDQHFLATSPTLAPHRGGSLFAGQISPLPSASSCSASPIRSERSFALADSAAAPVCLREAPTATFEEPSLPSLFSPYRPVSFHSAPSHHSNASAAHCLLIEATAVWEVVPAPTPTPLPIAARRATLVQVPPSPTLLAPSHEHPMCGEGGRVAVWCCEHPQLADEGSEADDEHEVLFRRFSSLSSSGGARVSQEARKPQRDASAFPLPELNQPYYFIVLFYYLFILFHFLWKDMRPVSIHHSLILFLVFYFYSFFFYNSLLLVNRRTHASCPYPHRGVAGSSDAGEEAGVAKCSPSPSLFLLAVQREKGMGRMSITPLKGAVICIFICIYFSLLFWCANKNKSERVKFVCLFVCFFRFLNDNIYNNKKSFISISSRDEEEGDHRSEAAGSVLLVELLSLICFSSPPSSERIRFEHCSSRFFLEEKKEKMSCFLQLRCVVRRWSYLISIIIIIIFLFYFFVVCFSSTMVISHYFIQMAHDCSLQVSIVSYSAVFMCFFSTFCCQFGIQLTSLSLSLLFEQLASCSSVVEHSMTETLEVCNC
eukprot:gene6354-4580_t